MNEKSFFEQLASSQAFRLSAVAAVALLALFLLVKSADALMSFGNSDQYPARTITVEGTGKATAIPNIAQITFTVTEQGTTVTEAQKEVKERTNNAIDAMKMLNIEEKDIKTLSYNVSPRYEYQQPCYSGICPPVESSPRIIGYEVSQTIEVKVRDTEKTAGVLQDLGDLGVQGISGPNFVVEEEDSVHAQARDEAIAEARENAKKLAQELGVSLGKVVSFSENQPYYYDGYAKGGVAMDMAENASAPAIPVGENESSVTVMVTYEIR